MTTTTTLTLGALIEETLTILYRETERPKPAVLGTTINSSATTFTLTAGGNSVAVTTVLQFGLELMLVTNKSNDANPTYTVSRGYAGTSPISHTVGEVGEISPYWTRNRVRQVLLHAFTGPMNRHLPFIESVVDSLDLVSSTYKRFISVPANVMDVKSVRYMHPTSGRIVDVAGWRLEQDLPTSVVSTTKAIRVSSHIGSADQLIITYQVPYTWSATPPVDASTISVPLGSEDIAPLYVAAYLSLGRELSRLELDKVEEWNNEAAIRNGYNLGVIRQLWTTFYNRVDEARRLHPVPRNRVYRRWAKV